MLSITRRRFLKSTAVAGGALAMPGIIGRARAASVVNVLGQSSVMPPQAFRDKFTAETGIEIRLKSGITDSSQIFNLLAAEGSNRETDMIVVPAQSLFSFTATGMLDPLADAEVPGLANINPIYLNWPGALIDGKRYGIPVAAYANLIVYRNGVVDEADGQSWNAVFGDKYAGRITLREGGALPSAMFALGLSDIWWDFKGGDPAPIEQLLIKCREFVIARKHVLRKWYRTAAEFQQLFLTNEIDVGQGLSQHAMPLVVSDPATFKRVVPIEGTNGSTQNYCIVAGAANREGALKFINAFLTEPNMSGAMTRSTGVMSTFSDPTAGLNEQEKQAFFFSDEELARIRWQNVTSAQDPRFPLQEKYTVGLSDA